MKRLAMLALFSLTTLAWSSLVWPDDTMQVTNPDQVASLLDIQGKIDSLSTAVMVCIDSGKTHNLCLCESEALLVDFNDGVSKLFIDHPDLVGQDLVTFKTPDGMWVSQSLTGIKQQANTVLFCP